MRHKYAVFPGLVQSSYDGQIHQISAEALMRLYKVNPSDCFIVTKQAKMTVEKSWLDSLIHLHPRFDGDYTLPGK